MNWQRCNTVSAIQAMARIHTDLMNLKVRARHDPDAFDLGLIGLPIDTPEIHRRPAGLTAAA